jgi:hypothetical protein
LNAFGAMLMLCQNANKSADCEWSEIFLNKLVKNKIEESNDYHFEADLTPDWFNNVQNQVIEKIQNSINDSISNPFFNTTFPKYLRTLSSKLVFWNALLPYRAGSKRMMATSSGLETFHNIFKNNILEGSYKSLDEVVTALEMFFDERLSFKGNINFCFFISTIHIIIIYFQITIILTPLYKTQQDLEKALKTSST